MVSLPSLQTVCHTQGVVNTQSLRCYGTPTARSTRMLDSPLASLRGKTSARTARLSGVPLTVTRLREGGDACETLSLPRQVAETCSCHHTAVQGADGWAVPAPVTLSLLDVTRASCREAARRILLVLTFLILNAKRVRASGLTPQGAWSSPECRVGHPVGQLSHPRRLEHSA